MEPPQFNEELSKYPPRPADNDQGADTQVQTNYSRVELLKKSLYVYRVSIVNKDTDGSEVNDTTVRKEIFLNARASSDLATRQIYFDGKDYAYAAKSLFKDRDEIVVSAECHVPDLCLFEVRVRMLRRYEAKVLERYCAGDTRVPDSYVQGFMFALDAIVRSCPKPQLVEVGGRFLSDHRMVTTPWGYDVWWEYRLTMRPGRGALFVNIGAKSVPVINVTDLAELSWLFFEKRAAMLHRKKKATALEIADWAVFEPAIRGLSIVHREETLVVTGLSTVSASEVTVEGGSLASHYQRLYGQDIGDPSMPCAMADKRAVPLSHCLLPRDKRQILGVVGAWQRDDFLRISAVGPEHRHSVLAHGMRILAGEGSPELRAFGIQISPTLERVGARVFDAPRIMLRQGQETKPVVMREGGWEMGGLRVVSSSQLRSWSVLVFGHQQGMPPALLRTFVNQYVKICVQLGIDVQQTMPPVKYATAWNDIEQTLGEARALAQGPQCQLVLCVLPFNSVSLYGEIKRVAMTLIGVQTQCVQASHVRSHNPKLLTSVALKMNVKLGGFTGDLHSGDLPGMQEHATMIIAADVNHTTEAGGMSVAAIMSSTDARGGRFAGTVLQHPQRMEYIENFDVVIRQALRLFHQSTGLKPARIVYYRDGVNDSQMGDVKQIELDAIYRGCRLIDAQYRPLVTLVLIRKRHQSRFLHEGANCVPGTCVAGGAVSPSVFSFYLVAHRSPFGVSRPAYYLVLHDDVGFAAEDLKRLTYSLSFMYPIVSRSVTMPAALYYAHRLTGKGRLQLSRAFNTLPYFTKAKADEKAPRPHLVAVHEGLRDSMYFM
ncbi:hypothetical protein H4S02_007419 [Coemansia sp. RSA 2611]|nr:hypothetical protein H4S02_007419 [Coemansia sp. RSA 2611]